MRARWRRRDPARAACRSPGPGTEWASDSLVRCAIGLALGGPGRRVRRAEPRGHGRLPRPSDNGVRGFEVVRSDPSTIRNRDGTLLRLRPNWAVDRPRRTRREFGPGRRGRSSPGWPRRTPCRRISAASRSRQQGWRPARGSSGVQRNVPAVVGAPDHVQRGGYDRRRDSLRDDYAQ